jgi:hypothetical protein
MLSIGVTAQARPDFSGTWELDVERTRAANQGSGGSMGGGGSMSVAGGTGSAAGAGAVTTIRITQTAAALTIERVAGQVWDKTVHKLDGTDSVNTNSSTTIRLKSRWDGRRLISEGTSRTPMPEAGGTMESTFKETRWLDKDGTLIVETVRVVNPPPGVQVSNAGQPRTTMQYFRKKQQ